MIYIVHSNSNLKRRYDERTLLHNARKHGLQKSDCRRLCKVCKLRKYEDCDEICMECTS